MHLLNMQTNLILVSEARQARLGRRSFVAPLRDRLDVHTYVFAMLEQCCKGAEYLFYHRRVHIFTAEKDRIVLCTVVASCGIKPSFASLTTG